MLFPKDAWIIILGAGICLSLAMRAVDARDTDPCSQYTSCAACTGARYYHSRSESFSSPERNLRRSAQTVNGDIDTTMENSARHLKCKWCDAKSHCTSFDEFHETASYMGDDRKYIEFESMCPLQPPYPTDEVPKFLQNWMSNFMAISSFANAPLSQITLPGTHDSLSYDLSLTVSADGIDDQQRISEWLRRLSLIRPNEIEEFMRLQAMTQKLDIVQQLDNGIRFIDLRIALENRDSFDEKPEWYSIHCLQSNHQVQVYLQLIRDWMDTHPSEILVIHLSRRGNVDAVGDDAYPNTSIEEKQMFWSNYVNIFEGMLFDTSVSDYRTTPVGRLIEMNHRLVTFATDYQQFTGGSDLAYDAKVMKNEYDADCFHEKDTIQKQRDYFFKKKKSNGQKWFALKGMNTAVNDWTVESALRQRFLPIDIFDPCAKKVNIPGNTMCPRSVMDIVQLTNYYSQIPFEEAFEAHQNDEKEVNFAQAFYLDGLDYDGTLRTGTTTLFGLGHEESDESFWYTNYAYVYTVIGFILHSVCKQKNVKDANRVDEEKCLLYDVIVKKKREEYPFRLWQEPGLARRNDWPNSPALAI